MCSAPGHANSLSGTCLSLLALLLGARTLLGAPGIATRSILTTSTPPPATAAAAFVAAAARAATVAVAVATTKRYYKQHRRGNSPAHSSESITKNMSNSTTNRHQPATAATDLYKIGDANG